MIIFHLLSLVYVVFAIGWADKMAFSWVRGTTPLLDPQKLWVSHRNVAIGLGLMILTGGIMFLQREQEMLNNPAFLEKMGFVALLIVNALVINKISKIATRKTYTSLTTQEKIPLFVSGIVSTIGWLGAFTLAFYLG